MSIEPRSGTASAANGAHPRWRGIERPYSAADVAKLRGTVHIEASALLGQKF
jgi:isocitrate lyase